MPLEQKKYPVGAHPDLPPPVSTTGPLAWIKTNLFSSPLNTTLTVLSLWLLWTIVPPFINWVFLESIWDAADRKDCWAQMPNPREGACWAFIIGSFEFFVYGWYPDTEKWRVNLSFIILIFAIVGVLKEKLPGKKYWLLFAGAFPFIAAWLLLGGFGLKEVETSKIGGILLTVIIGITGISFSLPIGIVLALGGASWPKLGSNGDWKSLFDPAELESFQASNCSFIVKWSIKMSKYFGQPLKSIKLSAGSQSSRGEIIISQKGIEGGGIYSLSAQLKKGEDLILDLLPDWDNDKILKLLTIPWGKSSSSNVLRKRLKLEPIKQSILREFAMDVIKEPALLTKSIKSLKIP